MELLFIEMVAVGIGLVCVGGGREGKFCFRFILFGNVF